MSLLLGFLRSSILELPFPPSRCRLLILALLLAGSWARGNVDRMSAPSAARLKEGGSAPRGRFSPSPCGLLAPAVPRPDHVVVVLEENHSYSEIIGSASAPYINNLAGQGVLFTKYFAQFHPSEQNYLEIFSGSDQGIGSSDPNPAPGSPFTTANWGGALLGNGFSFMGYSENLPSTGYSGADTGSWAYRHCPWIAFQGTGTNQIPAADNVAFSSFPSNYSNLPTVCMVTPNLNDDMHDGTIAQGDSWLQTNLDAYAQWAKTHNSLLIVVWDEDDGTQGNQVAMIMVGQMVQVGVENSQTLDHDSLCRLICDMYGLAPMANAAGATTIQGIWVGGSPPTVAAPASANPSSVTGTTSSLSVLGQDAGGEASLTYTWSATGPSGVTFSPNGTNAAKNSTATFSAAGAYTLTSTITNSGGLSVTSATGVTVHQTLSSVHVSPGSVSVVASGSQLFTATAQDQFGLAMSSQPSFSWSVSGGGTITSGHFTAGASAGGPFTVTASAGGLSGSASVTVTSSPPILSSITVSPTAASVPPSGTKQFSAVGLDQFGTPVSPQPTFGWSISGGGSVDTSGLFTAAASVGGPFTLMASSGALSGTAQVSVSVAESAPPKSGSGGGGCGLLGIDLLASLGLLAMLRRRSTDRR